MSGAGTLTDTNKGETRLAVIVNNDTDTAVALIERSSIEVTTNEENAEFDTHHDTRVVVDPTTEQPEVIEALESGISLGTERAPDGPADRRVPIAVQDGEREPHGRGGERRPLQPRGICRRSQACGDRGGFGYPLRAMERR